MGLRGVDTREKKYTPLGLVLRQAKFEHADREPAFGRGHQWVKGPCESCGKKVHVVEATRKCGACHIEERNG